MGEMGGGGRGERHVRSRRLNGVDITGWDCVWHTFVVVLVPHLRVHYDAPGSSQDRGLDPEHRVKRSDCRAGDWSTSLPISGYKWADFWADLWARFASLRPSLALWSWRVWVVIGMPEYAVSGLRQYGSCWRLGYAREGEGRWASGRESAPSRKRRDGSLHHPS